MLFLDTNVLLHHFSAILSASRKLLVDRLLLEVELMNRVTNQISQSTLFFLNNSVGLILFLTGRFVN
jgi:hypothetical protein